MNNIAIPDISVIIQNNKLDSEYNVLKELEETIIDLYDKNDKNDNDFAKKLSYFRYIFAALQKISLQS